MQDQCANFCRKNGIQMITTDSGEVVFSAGAIGKFLGISNIRQSLIYVPNTERQTLPVQTKGGLQKSVCLSFTGVQRVLSKSRSTYSKELAEAFNMQIHSNLFLPVESETVRFLMDAFKGFSAEPQYAVDKYRIDLYFPDHRLAVECDEEQNHSHLYISDDKVRQAVIQNKLQCNFVRFRPQASDFSYAKLVNECLVGLGVLKC